METKKEITINELAGAINKLDSKVDNRINKLAGAIDKLSKTVDKLAEITQGEFMVVENRMGNIENEIGNIKDEIKENFNRNLTIQDKILNSLVKLETDNEIGAGIFRRQNDQLENHEERIVVTEKKLGIQMAV